LKGLSARHGLGRHFPKRIAALHWHIAMPLSGRADTLWRYPDILYGQSKEKPAWRVKDSTKLPKR
jgi:hypothetical protein